MNWLKKIFGESNGKQEKTTPGKDDGKDKRHAVNVFGGLDGIRFGRYSDNNKTTKKTESWHKAEDLFKEKKYNESFKAFFDYLGDDEEHNVRFHQKDDKFVFELVQGSKKITGKCNGKTIVACAPLAKMPEPHTAVMRRLLDMNFGFYYIRTALDDENVLSMIFDTDVTSANINKMYYGLRELATKADKLDDLLIADFSTLQPAGTEHLEKPAERELEIKYRYFTKWLDEGLKRVDELNYDSFSGAIAYLLPVILYRIDFLMTPEAKMLSELERISGIYWNRKEDTTLVERNQLMKDAIRKMHAEMTREQFDANMYRVKATFSFNTPPKPEKIKDNIYSANKDSRWYVENKYPDIAVTLVEYGVLYNQFIYSMPAILTELATVFMAVLHAEYFKELGMKEPLYDPEKNEFSTKLIEHAVESITAKHNEKFPGLKWNNSRIKYDSLYEFAVSFSEQMANLNLDSKR
jgi:hypothetical protein